MKPDLNAFPMDRLAEFCRRWDIARLEVFGSAVRDDFGPASDLDLLVTFDPGSKHGLLDLAAAQAELEGLLGRRIDLVTRAGIERSRNWIRRREILETARPLYAA